MSRFWNNHSSGTIKAKIFESQIMYPSNTYREAIFHHHSCQLANLKLTVGLLMTDVICISYKEQ